MDSCAIYVSSPSCDYTSHSESHYDTDILQKWGTEDLSQYDGGKRQETYADKFGGSPGKRARGGSGGTERENTTGGKVLTAIGTTAPVWNAGRTDEGSTDHENDSA